MHAWVSASFFCYCLVPFVAGAYLRLIQGGRWVHVWLWERACYFGYCHLWLPHIWDWPVKLKLMVWLWGVGGGGGGATEQCVSSGLHKTDIARCVTAGVARNLLDCGCLLCFICQAKNQMFYPFPFKELIFLFKCTYIMCTVWISWHPPPPPPIPSFLVVV